MVAGGRVFCEGSTPRPLLACSVAARNFSRSLIESKLKTESAQRNKHKIFTPAYARYPFTAGWTGGGGGRQKTKNGQ